MNFAPIALFVFNRADHLKATLEALMKNDLAIESDLFVFSDGPSDDLKVKEVRAELKTITGFKSVSIIERTSNFGLAKSIVDGVSDLVNKFGRVIVLEDDIITSPKFLRFMNDALSLYKDDNQVMHISGYMFPIKDTNQETFFLKPTSCWGWATWKRAWDHFSNDITAIEARMTPALIKEFNLDNSYNYYEQILQNKRKERKTWAIFWYATVFLKNGLSLHPRKSYCLNIGLDGTGTNCNTTSDYDVQLNSEDYKLTKIQITENQEVRKELINYFNKTKPSIFRKILRRFLKK